MTRRVAIALALLLGAGCGGDEEAPPAEPLVAAATAPVIRGDFTPTIRASGTVVARSGALARLAAPAPSRVTAVHVNLGDRVAEGAPLVTLDAPLFSADSAGSAAALTAAQAAWERAVRLQHDGIVPAREVEQRAAELAQARAAAATSRRNAELSVLKAPMAGVVTALDAALGASVDPGTMLVEIVDPRSLDVAIALSPDDAARVRPGMHVTITAAGIEPLDARVVTIGAVVDPASRTVTVRARPLASTALRVAQTVRAEIALPTVTDATLVPASAIVPEGDSVVVVFTVDSSRVVHRTPITIGERSDSVVTVRQGISAGEMVVTAGAFAMVDGAALDRNTGSRP